jgi:antibiotic biosynthesis monooxygenase (ABM) superfamily enzyme
MYIRSAFWIGAPKAGQEKAFADGVNLELVPAMRKFPGVTGVKALWPSKFEDGPPAVALQILVEFDKEEDAATMLASPERAALRPRVKEVAGLFEGKMSHVEYHVAS